MKQCPSCDKTFDDSMKFCQVDGTLLVDEQPAFDPYATIVGQPMPTIPAAETPVEAADVELEVHQTVGSVPISEPEDVLELPQTDPLKTMYVSDSEMQAAMTGLSSTDEPEVIDLPPIESTPMPEPPSFIASEVPAPPPSPFSASENYIEETPASNSFGEAATIIQPPVNIPYEPVVSAPVEEWTPPPAPDSSWQNQDIGANTPFQPPISGVVGENKTLAIVSLVSGILGMTICCGAIIPSIVAIITGFMARGKANENPSEYGGAGLATAGLVTGFLGLVLGIVVIVLQVAFGILSNIN